MIGDTVDEAGRSSTATRAAGDYFRTATLLKIDFPLVPQQLKHSFRALFLLRKAQFIHMNISELFGKSNENVFLIFET